MQEKETKERISKYQYFLQICESAATRATCQKLRVGALLTDERGNIISTGYNGAPRGKDHCIDSGCILDMSKKCIRCVHAEANVLISAHKTRGTTLWCTHTPCWACCLMIINAGVKTVVFERDYQDPICTLLNFPRIESNVQTQYLLESNIAVFQYERK